MVILLVFAIIIGILQSRSEIWNTRNGITPGVSESPNLINFLFLKNNNE